MPINIFCVVIAFFLTLFLPAFSQSKSQTSAPSRLIEELLFLEMHKYYWVLRDYKKYNVQIIYTQIFRDSLHPVPRLEHHSFNLPEDAYIYPASTVKLPLIAQSFEKVNTINLSGLSKYSRMGTLAGKYCYEAVAGNIPSDKNPPSIAKYAEQILLVSDNQAYNRLYEFLGQAYLHQKLAQKGYEKIRIIKRFFFYLRQRFTKPLYQCSSFLQRTMSADLLSTRSVSRKIPSPSCELHQAGQIPFRRCKTLLQCSYGNESRQLPIA